MRENLHKDLYCIEKIARLVLIREETRFSHIVGNIDIAKEISSSLGIAFGAEFRNETFTVIEGALASYDGGGADSFAGNTPENSGKFNRYNIGGYFDLAWDVTDAFLNKRYHQS